MSHSFPCKHLNYPIIEFAAPRANFPFGVEGLDSMSFPKYALTVNISQSKYSAVRSGY